MNARAGDLFSTATALFSPCERYRYRLGRRWGDGPPVLFAMLNPSTATHLILDPTIRKDVGFAQRWEYGALEVVNLFGWRATDPRELYQVADPIGADNDKHIIQAASEAALIVCAWGVRGSLLNRDAHVLGLLRASGKPIRCFRTTKAGHPEHPLYMPYETQLIPFGEAA